MVQASGCGSGSGRIARPMVTIRHGDRPRGARGLRRTRSQRGSPPSARQCVWAWLTETAEDPRFGAYPWRSL